ncbi:hypothetical protein [Yanghanlia caeni]|uniref:Uncharacterized protein n=1 Tax=Yanghanlia caeni TaxID=3064283 RepID=A0ABU1D526_9BURK|nr:hypothetical protein [Alcaligenaceae bacterium LG-2]
MQTSLNPMAATAVAPIDLPNDLPVSLALSVGICATPRRPLTEAQFCDWIAEARVGEALQYHEGLLLRDRSETASALNAKERARLHAVARRAWIACELGLVHLFSVKVDEGHYRYLALRSAQTTTARDADRTTPVLSCAH